MATSATTTSVFQRGALSVKSFKVENPAISSETSFLYVVTPTEEGTYPVLQFLHGFMCSSTSYSQLLQHIASHGFIIVAPQLDRIIYILSGNKEIQGLAAITNWMATGLQPELPHNVYADFAKLGLAGHSKGGKTAFCLALGVGLADTTLNLKFSALIGIDPVAGINTLVRTEPHVLTYIPRAFDLGIPVGVIGTGLGSEKKNTLVTPCAPDGVNHAEFFNECKPPCCYFLAKDYGHMDMLDDKMAGLGGCICKSGTDPKDLMRRGTGGIVVAFMKAYLEGDDSDLLAIVNDPKIAPIKLEPVIYVPA